MVIVKLMTPNPPGDALGGADSTPQSETHFCSYQFEHELIADPMNAEALKLELEAELNNRIGRFPAEGEYVMFESAADQPT